jgi:hypothetical protein
VVGRQPAHDQFSKGGVITFWSLNGTIVLSGDFISNTATVCGLPSHFVSLWLNVPIPA